MYDLAEPEGQVGKDVGRGCDLEHRQVRDRRQGVRRELQRGRTGPGALYRDVLEMIFDQLADARLAVDMRNDFDVARGAKT
jgi:hypothetical protein